MGNDDLVLSNCIFFSLGWRGLVEREEGGGRREEGEGRREKGGGRREEGEGGCEQA
jgi:hypothetical protein